MPKFVPAAEAIIKERESLRLAPYLDGNDVPTIGWGHTQGVTMDMAPITLAAAQMLFKGDVSKACTLVINHAGAPLNDNQFSALVSLVFNCGVEPLLKTLGHKLRAGDYEGAANEFDKWHFDNGKSERGLVTRRAEEKALFKTPC